MTLFYSGKVFTTDVSRKFYRILRISALVSRPTIATIPTCGWLLLCAAFSFLHENSCFKS